MLQNQAFDSKIPILVMFQVIFIFNSSYTFIGDFMFKKIFLVFILILLCLSQSSIYADDIDSDEAIDVSLEIQDTIDTLASQSTSSNVKSLDLNSRACVVLDRTSKTVLFGKNEKNKVKMASTTKIMTAIVIIENCDLNQTIEASKKAASTGGSRLGLKTGDKITVLDLLYGLMLRSGNDAAVALAETASGNIANFSNKMNQKAQEIGLSNTHFESPHGLDSDGHYTTAYELAILTDYALKNPTFANIVGSKNYTITINGYPQSLNNTNELLGNLNGVYGVKTGFTNGANRCLVTSCKRNDLDIICVVLGADTKKFRTKDSIKLIEYAFENFELFNAENKLSTYFEEWKNVHMDSFIIEKGSSNNLRFDNGAYLSFYYSYKKRFNFQFDMLNFLSYFF